MNDERRELFGAMLERPRMYFGEGQNFLWAIEAVGFGYQLGYRAGSGCDAPVDSIPSLIPEGFAKFIIARLGENSSRPSWIYRILDSTETPEEAFDLFKQLYFEFKERQG